MEELLNVLQKEKEGYDALLTLNEPKRKAIVKNKIDDLYSVTEKEEKISTYLKNMEKKRLRILKDMAVVLGQDGKDLTVTAVIDLLSGQPENQKALTEARDALVRSARDMRFMNEQNTILLEQALELVEFDLTLFKSMKQAPTTANYDRFAANTGDLLGGGGFDAKQ
jgi:flagellar biosynthesis/type III secretory pathway chaperone